jgi:hypothetical protein
MKTKQQLREIRQHVDQKLQKMYGRWKRNVPRLRRWLSIALAIELANQSKSLTRSDLEWMYRDCDSELVKQITCRYQNHLQRMRKRSGGAGNLPVLFYNDTNRPLIYAWYRTSPTGSDSKLLGAGILESGNLKQPQRIPRPPFELSFASRDLLVSTLPDPMCAFPKSFPVNVSNGIESKAITIRSFVRQFPDRYYLWSSPKDVIGARDLSIEDAKSALINCFGDQKCESRVRTSIHTQMSRDIQIATLPSSDCPLPRRYGGKGENTNRLPLLQKFSGHPLRHIVLQNLPGSGFGFK